MAQRNSRALSACPPYPPVRPTFPPHDESKSRPAVRPVRPACPPRSRRASCSHQSDRHLHDIKRPPESSTATIQPRRRFLELSCVDAKSGPEAWAWVRKARQIRPHWARPTSGADWLLAEHRRGYKPNSPPIAPVLFSLHNYSLLPHTQQLSSVSTEDYQRLSLVPVAHIIPPISLPQFTHSHPHHFLNTQT